MEKFYRKTGLQAMRPYIPGEDLTGVSVADVDTPEKGGMVAIGENRDDKWYVAKAFFEKNYEEAMPKGDSEDACKTDNMTFGLAIEAMKDGKKVARKGWNGKNMFIVYMSPMYLPPFTTQGTARKVNDRTAKWIGEDTPLDTLGYFAMFTADKKWLPGWLASQTDMLADDWEIVE